ncbi:MAG: phage/plasmid primase, P4 family [Sulfuricaulis sp.]
MSILSEKVRDLHRLDTTAAMLDALPDLHAQEPELTEDALALSFCDAVPTLRYVARWNHWMTWNDALWREDDTLAVFDRIRKHVRGVLAGKRGRNAIALTKAQAIAAIERLARADRRYAATVDQWDADDWLLNTPGGVVDLRTGELQPHNCGRYMTKMTSVAPGGNCPMWKRFLEDITAGDSDYIAFLQRVCGYAATSSTREHAIFFAHGGGGNGKGTFLNTLQRVLADYATVAPMEVFTDSKHDRHPTELAMLRGARLVLAQETEEGRAWAESKIKALTGGDPITARYMRQDFFTFTPKFKLLVAGNHKPSLRNVDEAMRRRLHLLPFTVTFTKAQRDTDLAEKLMAEAGGVLQWIIDGSLAYQREGLNPPAVVTDATAEYFSAENLFEQWLADCCELGLNLWETPTRLFGSWKRYAESANERAGTQKLLAERLLATGFRSGLTRAKGGRHWDGLRLRDTGHDDIDGWQK